MGEAGSWEGRRTGSTKIGLARSGWTEALARASIGEPSCGAGCARCGSVLSGRLVPVGSAGDDCCGSRMGESGSQTGRGGVMERGGACPGCGLKEDTLMVMYTGLGCALRRSRVWSGSLESRAMAQRHCDGRRSRRAQETCPRTVRARRRRAVERGSLWWCKWWWWWWSSCGGECR